MEDCAWNPSGGRAATGCRIRCLRESHHVAWDTDPGVAHGCPRGGECLRPASARGWRPDAVGASPAQQSRRQWPAAHAGPPAATAALAVDASAAPPGHAADATTPGDAAEPEPGPAILTRRQRREPRRRAIRLA